MPKPKLSTTFPLIILSWEKIRSGNKNKNKHHLIFIIILIFLIIVIFQYLLKHQFYVNNYKAGFNTQNPVLANYLIVPN